jgi:hypothetical protein
VKFIVGVASVSANLSWSGNTHDRQAGNRNLKRKAKAFNMNFSFNGKPRTHSKMIGVCELFAGTVRAPRWRKSNCVAKRSKTAKLGQNRVWFSRTPKTGLNWQNVILFTMCSVLSIIEALVESIVGVASVSANLSWSGNTHDRQAGNRNWVHLLS